MGVREFYQAVIDRIADEEVQIFLQPTQYHEMWLLIAEKGGVWCREFFDEFDAESADEVTSISQIIKQAFTAEERDQNV